LPRVGRAFAGLGVAFFGLAELLLAALLVTLVLEALALPGAAFPAEVFFAGVPLRAALVAWLFPPGAAFFLEALAFAPLAAAERPPLPEAPRVGALGRLALAGLAFAGLACFFFWVFAAIDWIQELARDGSRAMKKRLTRGE